MAPARHDLWLQSAAGDGRDDPATLGPLAAAAGLAGFALVDHHSVRGLEAAAESARETGLAFLPGVSLDADASGFPAAIFGFGIDPAARSLTAALAEAKAAAARRVGRIRDALAEAGIRLPDETAPDEAALVAAGFAPSRHAARRRYFEPGGLAHVPAEVPPAAEALAAVRAAGGRAVLRPGHRLVAAGEALQQAAARLAADGLLGVLAVSRSEQLAWEAPAARLGLAVFGGSGYRGAGRGPEPGEATTSAAAWARLGGPASLHRAAR